MVWTPPLLVEIFKFFVKISDNTLLYCKNDKKKAHINYELW